jgi:NAD(P)-dependent dehydrogenase (short-subunit alcohol dehydrogenase family)
VGGILEGKVAVITGVGGPTSMGATAARLFHAEGASLVLADVSGQERDAAAALADRAIACNVDVAKSDQVAHMIDLAVSTYGGLDILCNAAGVSGVLVPIADTTEENFDHMIDVNLRGVFLTMKAAIPHMIARGGGSIVNIASTAALIGTPQLGTYAASKAGVVALTKVTAVEYGRQGIRANAICPGVIETPMYDAGVVANPGIVDYLKALVPMGRSGKPEEIAEAMLFLASSRSSYITGLVLPVEGGQTTA